VWTYGLKNCGAGEEDLIRGPAAEHSQRFSRPFLAMRRNAFIEHVFSCGCKRSVRRLIRKDKSPVLVLPEHRNVLGDYFEVLSLLGRKLYGLVSGFGRVRDEGNA